MRENLIRRVFLGLFIAFVLYGTYNESMKQHELYQYNRDLLEHGTIVKAEDFYRTGIDNYALGYTYRDLETGAMHTGANYGMTNVTNVVKQDSINIVYIKDVDSYYAKYYDKLLEEMTPWYIISRSLFYVILILSVWIPLWIMKWILLRQINAKLERGKES